MYLTTYCFFCALSSHQASKAQVKWAKTTFEHRADCIRRFQSLLTKNVEELALLMSNEMGKPVAHARGEINNTVPRIQVIERCVNKNSLC
jgi:acyl-CoA reductase-like NAD-dependent aldehyde dehydrogenase